MSTAQRAGRPAMTDARSPAVFAVTLLLLTMDSLFGRIGACQMLVPSELLNACTFETLALTVPSTSFTIDRDTCNDVVDKEVFAEQPYVYFAGADDDKTYMVLMVDPDAPNHVIGEFYLHWLVMNIPGYILKQGLGYNVADTMIEYIGPQPPAFSGPHRYMVLAYEQLAVLDAAPVPEYRARFVLADWFEALGGDEVVRGPVASGGFVAEF